MIHVGIGAIGDGKILDTVAIQTAIDECGAKEDGGIVEFEAGKTYVSGSLQIPSKVSLSLLKKTVLKASTMVRFHSTSQAKCLFVERYWFDGLISQCHVSHL